MLGNNKYAIGFLQSKWVLPFGGILFMTLLLCFPLCKSDNENKNAFPEGIKDSYVAVLPFKNNTGNSDLDALGEMVADWIKQGLSETKEGKIISMNKVNKIIAQAKEQQFTPDNSISQNGNVHFLIEGNYYMVDSSLMFSSNIKNIESGEVVFAFPVIEGTEQEVMQLVEQLKQQILGFWVTKNLVDYKRDPPTYEAYKAFLEGIKLFDIEPYNAGLLLEKAMLLDSSFLLAKIMYARNLNKQDRYGESDSIRMVLEQNKNRLTPLELSELKYFEASITKNYNLYWRHLSSEKKPFFLPEFYWHWFQANTLMSYFNQNEKAFAYLQDVDFSLLDYKLAEEAWLYFLKAISYYKKGDFTNALEMVMNPPFEMSFQDNWATLIFFQIELLAKMKAYEGLDERLEHYVNFQPSSVPYPSHYQRFFAIRSMFSADPKTAERYAREYLRFLKEEYKDFSKARFNPSLGEITCALHLAMGETEIIESIIQNGTGLNDSRIDVLTLKGIYNAQEKNEIKAKEIIFALNEMRGKYDYGEIDYCSAIIEAWLGNKQLACSFLKEAQKKGKPYYYNNFDGDWRLRPLFDYPDFINNVLAPVPLPELETISEDKPKIAQNYWIYILGLLIAGLALYLFQRSRQPKRTELSTVPTAEPGATTVIKEDEFLTSLKKIVEDNINDPNFSMPQLCKALGVSRAKIYRKVKDLTGKSPSVYIRSFKLQKAKDLLNTTDLNISEIAFQVGFNDLSYFSRSFSEEFGVPPSETRK